MTTVHIDPHAIAAARTSVERVLAHRGLGAPARPFRTAEDFDGYWRHALELYGSGELAVLVASELPVGVFGRTDYAFGSAATLGDALKVFQRDVQHAVSGLEVSLDVVGQHAALEIRGPAVFGPIIEILIGLVAARCRQLLEPAVRIIAVNLPCAQPKDPIRWRQHYSVEPRFNATHGTLVIPAVALTQRLRTSDATVRNAIGAIPVTSTADEVRDHVRVRMRECGEADHVARALGMSLRTLQRRLADEGVTFREVVLDTKIEIAKQLLARGRMTVTEVASAVGFSRLPAFSRAFSRRAGTRPSALRSKAYPVR